MNRRTVFLILSFFLLRVGIHLPGFSEEPAAAPIPAVGQPNQYGTCTKRALDWLKQNQNADGSWGDSHKGAMTGFGLLSFLSHGHTPESPDYGNVVADAVTWILKSGTEFDGRLCMAKEFSQPGVYEHGICTNALGQYYVVTGDKRVFPLLGKAVGYIVEGQGPKGGWMYSYDKSADDLSVSAWQIEALHSAHVAKLEIPGVAVALKKAMKYLETMKGPKGGYGYRMPEDRYSLTGAAIFCRILCGAERDEVRQGVAWLLDETEKNKPVKYHAETADLYAWYFHTRVFRLFGGSAWTKWNDWYQDEIVNVQSQDGSWPIPKGRNRGLESKPDKTGQVYRTTLCLLMLDFWNRRWRTPSHSKP